MSALLFWIMLGGLALTTFSAIATVVLSEIAWHELEEYCKQKKQTDSFGRIFERRDQFSLGAGILQMVATAVAAVSMTAWLLESRTVSGLSGWDVMSITGLVAFTLVFCGSWIPWAVASLAAAPFLFRTWRWWYVVSALAWPLMVGGRFVTAMIARASGKHEEDEDEKVRLLKTIEAMDEISTIEEDIRLRSDLPSYQ